MTTGKEVIQECESKMKKTVEATKEKFTSIRAGRASVAMLDTIKVEQYGSEMPLNQVATVSAPEARLLVIDPWDKTMIPKIEKAILAANLGMNPNNDGRVVRLVMPELTAERRKEYVKLAKKEAENGKIAVRNIRKDMNTALKKIEKDKESGGRITGKKRKGNYNGISLYKSKKIEFRKDLNLFYCFAIYFR